MLASLAESVSGSLDRRFLFNALVPCLLFVALLTIVVVYRADLSAAAAGWERMGNSSRLWRIGAIVAGAWLLAVVLAAQTGQILRLYEGYWSTAAGRLLAAIGRTWHLRRLAALASAEDNQAYHRLHLGYPLPTQLGQVMPTRFGNVLKSAELYSRDRYDIDAAIVWPRLYQVLPDRAVSGVAAARGGAEMQLTASLLATVFAVVSGAYLVASGDSLWRSLACFWGGLLVAWLLYRGAVGDASVYGQYIRTAFDVYRMDLLKQLQIEAPADPAAERRLWLRLAYHWQRGIPLDVDSEPDPGETVPLAQSDELEKGGGAGAWKGLVLPLDACLAIVAVIVTVMSIALGK